MKYSVKLTNTGRKACFTVFAGILVLFFFGPLGGFLLGYKNIGLALTSVVVIPFFVMLLRQFGLAKWICCHMGWHSPSREWIEWKEDHTGVLSFGKCPWCGYKGQIDSQGNLF